MSNEIAKRQPETRTMDYWAGEQLIRMASGEKANDTTKRNLREEIDAFADRLGGPNPSPMEKSLAATASICWFALRTHEGQYAGAAAGGDMTLAQSEHAQRRLDRAHRRYLATIKTLATVRRLALPAIQVNMAHQQVNLAGT